MYKTIIKKLGKIQHLPFIASKSEFEEKLNNDFHPLAADDKTKPEKNGKYKSPPGLESPLIQGDYFEENIYHLMLAAFDTIQRAEKRFAIPSPFPDENPCKNFCDMLNRWVNYPRVEELKKFYISTHRLSREDLNEMKEICEAIKVLKIAKQYHTHPKFKENKQLDKQIDEVLNKYDAAKFSLFAKNSLTILYQELDNLTLHPQQETAPYQYISTANSPR